jgi:hypothetical protein
MKGAEGAGADFLYGTKRIAQHLGLTVRQVEHMIARGVIPTFKLGAIVCSTRSSLQRHFDGLAINVDARGSTRRDRED